MSIHEAALWFLSKSDMTHKKLQKLCYYAQAWHCALFDKPMFDGNFEAWIHGPVNRLLYSLYARYGWSKIPQKRFNEEQLPDDALAILNAVYDTYGEFTGDELETLTHSDLPWQKARGTLQPWEVCTNIISNDDMHDYYLKQYEQAQQD